MVTGYKPQTLREALELRKNSGVLPFAGGTDLMVRYKSWAGTLPSFPKSVLFLGHLKELQNIELSSGKIIYGAGATLTEIMEYPGTPALLAEAIRGIAAPALRNVGTMAGNLCNASPAGDSICALYALGASVVCKSLSGERQIPVIDFVTGPGRTALADDEIVSAIIVPALDWTVTFYRKVGTRKANALSKLSFCGLAKIKGGRIDDVRIAVGAVGPTVVRSLELERLLAGAGSGELEELRERLLQSYGAMIVPIDDQRSTAAYRKRVALNLLELFIDDELKKGVS
ncbi:FAD binding domain-containing protein [Sediminispirochaeta smaragdinae]|uniref:Molybdopterin dehydrogenase FAD-binding protein n=1 Tax=Sediminispirochaeta smaragdinae (strain DSM 11293 / JCM 15392 / SEBR 4228) TaxID=573413 RepID=E1R496_SEDSS|nr:FAD binding domain-containing protein [Sediminispirochaeta smaragdinae]ADK80518.1 molybdopterin dehydrogenase FAD-binding protein [Sediminispirochaeta smaragdinae DSM 11293]